MTIRFVRGDCRDVLAQLPADSVHCVVTSPPYWGLRDYVIAPSVWGGDAKCRHVWGDIETTAGGKQPSEKVRWQHDPEARPNGHIKSVSGFCRCGAWRGAFGLEPTYQLYVEHAVEVFRAVRRVLRPDGTLWLNLGDSYATRWSSQRREGRGGLAPNDRERHGPPPDGLKNKDMCGIPWRVAFALQADGWWLRQDIIWSKPNPMPESVTDRCTKAHEYLFLLTKQARYYYDGEAIKEENAERYRDPQEWSRHGQAKTANERRDANGINADGANAARFNGLGRNKRSVWEIATSPFPEAHFATFPPALVEPCIKAGTSEKGCCAKCGAPWERKTKTEYDNPGNRTTNGPRSTGNREFTAGFEHRLEKRTETLGWQPTCACQASVIPCTVLDPFGGAGTTGLVADRLQRNAILIELGAKYVAMARRRIAADRKRKVKARRRSVRRPAPPQASTSAQLRIAACRR